MRHQIRARDGLSSRTVSGSSAACWKPGATAIGAGAGASAISPVSETTPHTASEANDATATRCGHTLRRGASTVGSAASCAEKRAMKSSGAGATPRIRSPIRWYSDQFCRKASSCFKRRDAGLGFGARRFAVERSGQHQLPVVGLHGLGKGVGFAKC